MRWLFWDTEPSRVDLRHDDRYVLGRVLEFGGVKDVNWVLRHYGVARVHSFFRDGAHPEISKPTREFWRAALNAERETWRTPSAFRQSSSAYWVR